MSLGPNWLRQRAVGRCKLRPVISSDTIKSLQQECLLEGHSGCVNCLEWSQDGDLLASGSDDCRVIIWSPFASCKRRQTIKTQHSGNIFSVKFMPSDMNLVATCASDRQVLVTDTSLMSGRTLMSCNNCHSNRVKRLITHPSAPSLIWSAGEDGYVMQYDTREQHQCHSITKPKNALIDLRAESLSAKCIASHPIRDELLAIGCDDVSVRLYDRRSPEHPVARFVPGHLSLKDNRSRQEMFGATYVTFSPDGSELLANLHAEQIYLFNTYEPTKSYKSFDKDIKPLLLDAPLMRSNCSPVLRTLQELDHTTEMDRRRLDMCLQGGTLLQQIEQLNSLLAKVSDCPDLYNLRASLLIKRRWKGDYWQALRDSLLSLALRPLDYLSIKNLAEISINLNNKDIARGLLDMIRQIIQTDADTINEAQRLGLERSAQRLSSFIKEEDLVMNELANDKPLPIEIIASDNNQSCDILLSDFSAKEYHKSQSKSVEFDSSKRFCGHCNVNTDIKEANFFGSNGEFIVAGSDDGALYVWDKSTTNIVKAMSGDAHILNCVQPHPTICMLATSGVESSVRIWSTCGRTNRDVMSIEARCSQNQDYINVDPLEAMIMMLYPENDL